VKKKLVLRVEKIAELKGNQAAGIAGGTVVTCGLITITGCTATCNSCGETCTCSCSTCVADCGTYSGCSGPCTINP
jgi:hypothetical protein